MDADDHAEIAALAQVSITDPDHVQVNEAEDEGDMVPRSFLGATNSGDGGTAEPLADAEPTPTVAAAGPPALTPSSSAAELAAVSFNFWRENVASGAGRCTAELQVATAGGHDGAGHPSWAGAATMGGRVAAPGGA